MIFLFFITYSSQPQYRWVSHVVVWSFSTVCASVLAALHMSDGSGPGMQTFIGMVKSLSLFVK